MTAAPTFNWIDAQKRPWTIRPEESGIVMTDGSEVIVLPRESWPRDLHVTNLDSTVVIRFQGPERDIGFLLPREQAETFFSLIGWTSTADTALETPNEDVVVAASPRRRSLLSDWLAPKEPARELLWPTMPKSAVWSLILASLAFLPFIGVGFAMAASMFMIYFFREIRQRESLRHARIMVFCAAIIAGFGTLVCALSTWGFLQVRNDRWTFLDLAVLTPEGSRKTTVAISLVVILLSLTIHEAAHAVTAWWCGDDYARSLGRVTLNPLAHIDLFGTIFLPAMLAYFGAPVFGFAKPVPVRLTGVGNYRRAHILISAAGPGSNLLLAALSFSVLLGLACLARLVYGADLRINPASAGSGVSLLYILVQFLVQTFIINLFLAFFNLVPIPPLDGSWIIEHLYPQSIGRFYARIRPYGMLVFLAMIYLNAFTYLLTPVAMLAAFSAVLIWMCSGISVF